MTEPKTVGWLKRYLANFYDDEPVFLECDGVRQPLQLVTNGIGVILQNGDLEIKIKELAKTKGNITAIKYCKDMTGKSVSECAEIIERVTEPSFNG